MSIISLTITDPSIDRNKLVRMAVVHDLAEALVGDIVPNAMVSIVKHGLEMEAMNTFVEQLDNSRTLFTDQAFALELKELWMEYEADASKEARLCKDIDKFEMILQAFEYEKGIKLLLM